MKLSQPCELEEDRADGERMTVVFEYDVRKFPSNPLHVETPFGKPFTVAMGDVTEERDRLAEQLNTAIADLRQCRLVLNEVRTNGSWTNGESISDWQISLEVYQMVCECLPAADEEDKG